MQCCSVARRHPSHITDHDQDHLERVLNDKTHSFTHICESEYQIVQDMSKFVNILRNKHDLCVSHSVVAAVCHVTSLTRRHGNVAASLTDALLLSYVHSVTV